MLLGPHYTAVFHETVVLAVTSSETGPVHSVIVSLLGLPQLPQVTRCFHALGIFLQCFQGFQGRIQLNHSNHALYSVMARAFTLPFSGGVAWLLFNASPAAGPMTSHDATSLFGPVQPQGYPNLGVHGA